MNLLTNQLLYDSYVILAYDLKFSIGISQWGQIPIWEFFLYYEYTL